MAKKKQTPKPIEKRPVTPRDHKPHRDRTVKERDESQEEDSAR